jgi:hypothetical protein
MPNQSVSQATQPTRRGFLGLAVAAVSLPTLSSTGCNEIGSDGEKTRNDSLGLRTAEPDLTIVYSLKELSEFKKPLETGMLIKPDIDGGALELKDPRALRVDSFPDSFYRFVYRTPSGFAITVLADRKDFALTPDTVLLASNQPLYGRVRRMWLDARAASLEGKLPEAR